MAYPEYIPTRTVSVGGAMVLESSDLLKIAASVKASRPLIWADTGYRFESLKLSTVGELGSEVTFPVPRTDVPGWKDSRSNELIDVSAEGSYSHRYTIEISFLSANGVGLGIPTYTIGPFILPDGEGPLDLDKLIPTGTVSGDTVSIPDSWSAKIAAAEAAALAAEASLIDSAEFVATQISTTGTPAEMAVTAKIAGAVEPLVEDALPGLLPDAGRKIFTGKTTLTPGRSGEVLAPEFVDYPHNLLTHTQLTSMPSIATMRVICTDGIIASPLGRFYAYISTDHDTSATSDPPWDGKGGIVLAYADSPIGPWTIHRDGSGDLIIWQDTVVGNQTETPTPLYVPDDPDGLPIYIYYQNQGVGLNQSTLLARSATGLPEDFQRYGLVVQGRGTVDPVWPGDGQSTYLEPQRINGRIIAVHLMGGGDWAQYGRSYSVNGRTFVTDPRRFGHFSHLVGADNGRRVSIRSLFQWRGNPWAIVTIGNHTSGFVTAPRQVGFMQLSTDLRRAVGRVHTLTDTTVGAGQVLEHEGKLYLFYRTGDAYSAFRCAIAEA